MRRFVPFAAFGLLSWGCREAPPPDAPTAQSPPLSVELAGCAAVLAGPVCELSPERTVRLFVRTAPEAALTLTGGTGSVGNEALSPVSVAPGATSLEVSATRPGARPAVWRVEVRDPKADSVLDEVAALRKAGQPDEAGAKIEAALPGAPPERAGRLLGLRGRIALARGDAEAAIRDLRAALPLHRAAGRVSNEVQDALVMAFVQIHQTRDFTGARATLEALVEVKRLDAEAAAAVTFHFARLALETGDLRGALAALDEAEPVFDRLGLAARKDAARQARADALAALGRHAEAVEILRARHADATRPPCTRAQLGNDLAWALLGQAGEGPPPDEAGALFEASAQAFEQTCAMPDYAATTRLNLALLALRRGDAPAARAALEAARRALPKLNARVALWLPDVEGRLALAENQPGVSRRHFEHLRALGGATASAEAEWRGAIGLARALDALRAPGATDAFAAAEALLSDQALLIPLAEGRETFFAEREAGTRDFVEHLVRAGDASRALEVTRRARARFLAAVRRAEQLPSLPAEARARWEAAIGEYQHVRAALDAETAGDWELPADALAAARAARSEREKALRAALDAAFAVLPSRGVAADLPLAPPAEGETLLSWMPVREGVLAFAATGAETRAVRLPSLTVENALVAFEEQIAAARRLRLLPYGPARTLDLHALPFRGRPLVAQAPVVYGLDLPGGSDPPGGRQALVVTDPRGDLAAARTEGEAVRARLAGWTVEHLAGEAATGPAVRVALGRAALLHYSGHGRFAGQGGWESLLPLAGDGRLTVHDILALPRVPHLVVLSGCETARQADSAPVEGVGLAQAFLTAGAGAAIAATRPVDDGLAADLLGGLYTTDPTADPAESLRRAQLQIARTGPSRDWSAFRILVR